MFQLFDTHCHLAGTEMQADALSYAQRAFENNVRGLALISADEASMSAVKTLAEKLEQKFPNEKIVYTSGVHPHDASKVDENLWNKIEASALGGASAIGETGLDYYYEHSDRKVQQEYFLRHIDLAKKTSKPLVIHCRDAKEDVLACLQSVKGHPNPGILHCFTEDLPMAKNLLDMGFYISFSGILTFKNATQIQEVAKHAPLDRILIETDSPWLAPIPKRGTTNEPSYVGFVFEFLRQLRNMDKEQLAQILWENSCRVYQITSN